MIFINLPLRDTVLSRFHLSRASSACFDVLDGTHDLTHLLGRTVGALVRALIFIFSLLMLPSFIFSLSSLFLFLVLFSERLIWSFCLASGRGACFSSFVYRFPSSYLPPLLGLWYGIRRAGYRVLGEVSSLGRRSDGLFVGDEEQRSPLRLLLFFSRSVLD